MSHKDNYEQLIERNRKIVVECVNVQAVEIDDAEVMRRNEGIFEMYFDYENGSRLYI